MSANDTGVYDQKSLSKTAIDKGNHSHEMDGTDARPQQTSQDLTTSTNLPSPDSVVWGKLKLDDNYELKVKFVAVGEARVNRIEGWYQLECMDDRQQVSSELGIDLAEYEYVMRLRPISDNSDGTELIITRKFKREPKGLPKNGTVYLTYPFKPHASANEPALHHMRRRTLSISKKLPPVKEPAEKGKVGASRSATTINQDSPSNTSLEKKDIGKISSIQLQDIWYLTILSHPGGTFTRKNLSKYSITNHKHKENLNIKKANLESNYSAIQSEYAHGKKCETFFASFRATKRPIKYIHSGGGDQVTIKRNCTLKIYEFESFKSVVKDITGLSNLAGSDLNHNESISCSKMPTLKRTRFTCAVGSYTSENKVSLSKEIYEISSNPLVKLKSNVKTSYNITLSHDYIGHERVANYESLTAIVKNSYLEDFQMYEFNICKINQAISNQNKTHKTRKSKMHFHKAKTGKSVFLTENSINLLPPTCLYLVHPVNHLFFIHSDRLLSEIIKNYNYKAAYLHKECYSCYKIKNHNFLKYDSNKLDNHLERNKHKIFETSKLTSKIDKGIYFQKHLKRLEGNINCSSNFCYSRRVINFKQNCNTKMHYCVFKHIRRRINNNNYSLCKRIFCDRAYKHYLNRSNKYRLVTNGENLGHRKWKEKKNVFRFQETILYKRPIIKISEEYIVADIGTLTENPSRKDPVLYRTILSDSSQKVKSVAGTDKAGMKKSKSSESSKTEKKKGKEKPKKRNRSKERSDESADESNKKTSKKSKKTKEPIKIKSTPSSANSPETSKEDLTSEENEINLLLDTDKSVKTSQQNLPESSSQIPLQTASESSNPLTPTPSEKLEKIESYSLPPQKKPSFKDDILCDGVDGTVDNQGRITIPIIPGPCCLCKERKKKDGSGKRKDPGKKKHIDKEYDKDEKACFCDKKEHDKGEKKGGWFKICQGKEKGRCCTCEGKSGDSTENKKYSKKDQKGLKCGICLFRRKENGGKTRSKREGTGSLSNVCYKKNTGDGKKVVQSEEVKSKNVKGSRINICCGKGKTTKKERENIEDKGKEIQGDKEIETGGAKRKRSWTCCGKGKIEDNEKAKREAKGMEASGDKEKEGGKGKEIRGDKRKGSWTCCGKSKEEDNEKGKKEGKGIEASGDKEKEGGKGKEIRGDKRRGSWTCCGKAKTEDNKKGNGEAKGIEDSRDKEKEVGEGKEIRGDKRKGSWTCCRKGNLGKEKKEDKGKEISADKGKEITGDKKKGSWMNVCCGKEKEEDRGKEKTEVKGKDIFSVDVDKGKPSWVNICSGKGKNVNKDKETGKEKRGYQKLFKPCRSTCDSSDIACGKFCLVADIDRGTLDISVDKKSQKKLQELLNKLADLYEKKMEPADSKTPGNPSGN